MPDEPDKRWGDAAFKDTGTAQVMWRRGTIIVTRERAALPRMVSCRMQALTLFLGFMARGDLRTYRGDRKRGRHRRVLGTDALARQVTKQDADGGGLYGNVRSEQCGPDRS